MGLGVPLGEAICFHVLLVCNELSGWGWSCCLQMCAAAADKRRGSDRCLPFYEAAHPAGWMQQELLLAISVLGNRCTLYILLNAYPFMLSPSCRPVCCEHSSLLLFLSCVRHLGIFLALIMKRAATVWANPLDLLKPISFSDEEHVPALWRSNIIDGKPSLFFSRHVSHQHVTCEPEFDPAHTSNRLLLINKLNKLPAPFGLGRCRLFSAQASAPCLSRLMRRDQNGSDVWVSLQSVETPPTSLRSMPSTEPGRR